MSQVFARTLRKGKTGMSHRDPRIYHTHRNPNRKKRDDPLLIVIPGDERDCLECHPKKVSRGQLAEGIEATSPPEKVSRSGDNLRLAS